MRGLSHSGDGRLVFGPEIGDQLGNLRVCKGVSKGRHLLAAIEDLMRHLLRRPILVLPDVCQRRALLAADPFGAMTVSAILLPKEESAGLFVGTCGMGFLGGQDGLGQGDGE